MCHGMSCRVALLAGFSDCFAPLSTTLRPLEILTITYHDHPWREKNRWRKFGLTTVNYIIRGAGSLIIVDLPLVAYPEICSVLLKSSTSLGRPQQKKILQYHSISFRYLSLFLAYSSGAAWFCWHKAWKHLKSSYIKPYVPKTHRAKIEKWAKNNGWEYSLDAASVHYQ